MGLSENIDRSAIRRRIPTVPVRLRVKGLTKLKCVTK